MYDSAGFRWFVNSTGAQNRGYLAYNAADFGKANGLGNVSPLCSAAPIEIGNRVWRDSNANGVQEPGESTAGGGPSMAGITVRLYDAGNNLMATASTDAEGEYYFSSAAGTSTSNTIYNLPLAPNTTYQVRFDDPANYASGGPLSGMSVSQENRTFQAGNDDSSDSDAVNVSNPVGSLAGTFPVITLTTGVPGSNDHTFDVGFHAGPTAADVSVDGRVTRADGRGIRNVRLQLLLEDGTALSALTGPFGYYRFEGIPAGTAAILTIRSKRFSFAQLSVLLDVGDSLTGIDFVSAE